MTVDGTKILMAFRQGQTSSLVGLPVALRCAVEEIEGHRSTKALAIMVNIVAPTVHSGIHVDPYPGGRRIERWHLPIKTNHGAWVWFGDEYRWWNTKMWHGPLKYWEPHSVGNDGDQDRVHLVVDLDKDVL